MISGAIFDMDGLMFDTEKLFLDSWICEMEALELKADRQLIIDCVGLNHINTKKRVLDALGEDFDYESIVAKIRLRNQNIIKENGIPLKPGLFELLDFLRENQIKCAVATSTKTETAVRHLKTAGVYDYFTTVICGDMVENGKPAPDIFQLAAKSLELDPESCVVLEDSPHGIRGAYDAGCIPVMVPDLMRPDDETEKIIYAKCANLLEAIDLLKRLI